MDERYRECVHYLGNELQKVLGYIELKQPEVAWTKKKRGPENPAPVLDHATNF